MIGIHAYIFAHTFLNVVEKLVFYRKEKLLKCCMTSIITVVNHSDKCCPLKDKLMVLLQEICLVDI